MQVNVKHTHTPRGQTAVSLHWKFCTVKKCVAGAELDQPADSDCHQQRE